MIVTADSVAARVSNRRKTGNGWNTAFIGKNRNTLKDGETPPEAGVIYPMAFLVEKDAGAIVRPHFHAADQFQVVTQGSGRLGRHDIGSIAVHYTDAYSAYGPIVAAGEGVSWFTLRNTWDPGARYMPAAREQLRAARGKYQHRETTSASRAAWDETELSRLGAADRVTEMESADGLGSWRFRLPASGTTVGPDPGKGGGQFWVVLSGSASCGGSALLPVESVVFVGPEDAAVSVAAGSSGAELLCVQFPRLNTPRA
jgi:hypothetical protein